MRRHIVITYPGLMSYAYKIETGHWDAFTTDHMLDTYEHMIPICNCIPRKTFSDYVKCMTKFERAKVTFIEGGPYEADVMNSLKDIPYTVFIPHSSMIDKIINDSYRIYDSIFPDKGIVDIYKSTFESNMTRLRSHKNVIVFDPTCPLEPGRIFKSIADSIPYDIIIQ